MNAQRAASSRGLHELFDALLDVEEPARAAWLGANVADKATRAALLRLLAADAQAQGFLDFPVGEHAQRMAADVAMIDGLVGQLRIPAKPGQHSGGCRATIPEQAGPVSEAV